MHLKVSDSNGKETTVCLDRNAGTAIILRGHPEHLERAAALADAQGAPHLRMIVDPANQEAIDGLEDEGWTKTNLIVFQRNRQNGAKNKARAVRRVPS